MAKFNTYAYLFLGSALFLTDQISKATLLKTKADLEFISFFCNENLAWGIKIPPGFFYAFWMIIIGSVIFQFIKQSSFGVRLPLMLILSGGISNLIDRLVHGCVVDFIDLKFWPVFNLADLYITLGIIFIFVDLFRNKKILDTKY
jgi:signal peptidase II